MGCAGASLHAFWRIVHVDRPVQPFVATDLKIPCTARTIEEHQHTYLFYFTNDHQKNSFCRGLSFAWVLFCFGRHNVEWPARRLRCLDISPTQFVWQSRQLGICQHLRLQPSENVAHPKRAAAPLQRSLARSLFFFFVKNKKKQKQQWTSLSRFWLCMHRGCACLLSRVSVASVHHVAVSQP